MALRDALAGVESRRQVVEAEVRTLRTAAERARDDCVDAIERARIDSAAHRVIVKVCDARQQVVAAWVERIVTAALRAVFGRVYSFRFNVTVKRGVVAMVPQIGYTRKKDTHWTDAQAVGGGIADVVAIVLRVCVLRMRRPLLRPVLIADEPFKHVSEEFRPLVSRMVKKLADDTGFQFIIVSHEPEVAASADKVFRVTMKDGVSTIQGATVV